MFVLSGHRVSKCNERCSGVIRFDDVYLKATRPHPLLCVYEIPEGRKNIAGIGRWTMNCLLTTFYICSNVYVTSLAVDSVYTDLKDSIQYRRLFIPHNTFHKFAKILEARPTYFKSFTLVKSSRIPQETGWTVTIKLNWVNSFGTRDFDIFYKRHLFLAKS